MPPAQPKKPAHRSPADTSAAVDAFMATLEHPFAAEVAALRSAILGLDPSVQEGIKWGTPSFRTTEYFATTHLRSKVGLGLVLHLGAKVRAQPEGGVVIDDPEGILKWLAADRATVELRSADDLQAKLPALRAVLRQWLRFV